MIEAGISFYEKVLNKNAAVRELSGKDLYSVKGNEYPSIMRFNTVPITSRKKFLEITLEELRQKEADEKKATASADNDNNNND